MSAYLVIILLEIDGFLFVYKAICYPTGKIRHKYYVHEFLYDLLSNTSS